MDMKAEGNKSSSLADGGDKQSTEEDEQMTPVAGISKNGDEERPDNGLRIDIQLAEETGRKLGPAVLVTGGIGRHGGSRSVATTPCASKPPPSMLATATNRPTTTALNNDRGVVDRRAEIVVTGGGSRNHNTYPNAKKLSTLAVAIASGRLSRSSSTPPPLPTELPSRGQSVSSRLTLQQNIMERSGSASHLGEQNKVEDGGGGGVASSSLGEEAGAGGMKRRRSYGRVNEGGRALSSQFSDSDVIDSGVGASFGYNEGINMLNPPAAAVVARVRPHPRTKESAAFRVRKMSERHGQPLAQRTNSVHRTAVKPRPTLKMVNAILSEAMATAAAAAAAAAAAPASQRIAGREGGAMQVSTRMNSDGSSSYGHTREQQEYSRVVTEAAASVNAAGSVVSSAHYNDLGWAQRAFLQADEKYAGLLKRSNSVEGQWGEANRALQAASQAVAAPRAYLNETYRLYICAESYYRTGEVLVQSAEAQEKRANREIAKATEVLEVARRALVRAEVTLCDFDRSYFSPAGGRDESLALAGPGPQNKPGDDLVPKEEEQETIQEHARGLQSNASVPQERGVPMAVVTKSWTALHGAAPVHAGKEGGGAGAMSVDDDEGFARLAEALLEDSDREDDDDKSLQDYDAGAAANVLIPMNVGPARNQNEAPSGDPEGAVPVPAPPAVNPSAVAREKKARLDKEKYLRHLANTLQNARQNVCQAIAQKNRAQIEADRALLLVGARTAGDWSIAAERRSYAVEVHRKAIAAAAPTLRAVVEQAKNFKRIDRIRYITRQNLNLAWEARESARVRAEPRTTALFAAAAAAAAAAVAAAAGSSSSPTSPHGAVRRMNAFYVDDRTKTAVGGTQKVVPAGSAEQGRWRADAPRQVLRSPRGG